MRRERSDIAAILAASSAPRDVARVLGLLDGAEPQPGGGIKVRCPGHGERTASCSLTRGPDGTTRARCFGRCGLSGDVFILAAAVWSLDPVRDFHEIKMRLADAFRVDIARHERASYTAPAPRQRSVDPPPIIDDATFAAIVGPLLHLGRLDGSAYSVEVCAYLDGRSMLDLARAEGWAALPPAALQPAIVASLYQAAEPTALDNGAADRAEERAAVLAADGLEVEPQAETVEPSRYAPPFTAADLDRSGLFHGRAFPWKDHRLLIPWRGPSGRVIALRRRLIGPGRDKYVVPKGPSRAVYPYGIERLPSAPGDAPIAWVEGEIDTLALRALLAARGETAVVLGLGSLSGWRGEWASLARGRAVAVAFDVDAAGESKAPEVERACRAAGAVRIERWRPPAPAKDWADVWTAFVNGRAAA